MPINRSRLSVGPVGISSGSGTFVLAGHRVHVYVRLYTRYLQSYETGKMEGILKSIPIEWTRMRTCDHRSGSSWFEMTTTSEPCNNLSKG